MKLSVPQSCFSSVALLRLKRIMAVVAELQKGINKTND